MVDLNKDVKFVKSVGPNRVKVLNKLKIFTLKDLITYFPRDYEDRSKPKNICECVDGETVLIEGVTVSKVTELRLKKMSIYKLLISDGTGTATAVWYNQSYLKQVFKVGCKYKFYGKVSCKIGQIEIASPVFELASQTKNTGKIIPIYPLTYDITQNVIRKIIENGLSEVKGKLEETLPEYILKEYNLMELNKTIEQIHFPAELKYFNIARKRLVFEELLIMQLALLVLKNNYSSDIKGIEFDKNVKMSELINMIPFRLTNAQVRVLEEIDKDMESNKCMNRLLQGDVGSGKTVVAMISAFKAVKSGYQAAIMAPTAILASQHMDSFSELLNNLGIRCELLISSITKK